MRASSKRDELSPRLHSLLLAAIHEFINTAQPVGSHQLAARRSLGIRAAMVRNLMAELDESGYLRQPHTSAGRVPTERAFRYYVDHVVLPPIRFADRTQIELHYSAPVSDSMEMIRDTSRLLSLMTGQAALIMAPRLESLQLKQVQLLRLREHEVLAIFVVATGGVHSRLLRPDADYSQPDLDRMSGYLNDSLGGRTLEQAHQWIEQQLQHERALYDEITRAALVIGGELARLPSSAEIYVEGSSKALDQPEFADPARLRELLRALDDKTALLDLLERALAQSELIVSIGSENFDTRLAGLSVVASPYISGDHPLGSLAIVGPVRMDYQRVIPLVGYTARALSRALQP
ncbi:MAG TPA: heat-inducible transcriptional repressor HrcA [Candidatus Binataceae bacterium]|nr:heat-inducible transcriptional repressor HrcA [Candidatus Binataceae bacterium]